MIDPVTGAVLAVLILAAILFSYFARQANDDKKYDKLAKESARLLLQDKKLVPKPKVNKNKKEKKGEKKPNDGQQEKTRKESDSENSEDTTEPIVPETVHENRKPKESPIVENEPKGKKGKQNKKEKEPKASPQTTHPEEKPSEHIEATVVHVEPQLIEEIIVKREVVEIEETSPPSQSQKKSAPKKKKKAGPPPTDLDEHKVLGRIADVEELEPEYLAYLAQYFTDVNEKTTQLTINLSGLEKTIFDLRQKAEGHCAARMNAEKDAQSLQRQTGELTTKIRNLEKDLVENKKQAELFKKKAAESAALVVVNADATAEVHRLKQNEVATQQQIQKLNQQLRDWQTKAEASAKEAQTLRSSQESKKENHEEVHKLQEELRARDSTIAQIKAEFEDLEVMTRDLIAEKENLEKLVPQQEMIPKKFAEATEDALRTLKLEMKDKNKDITEKQEQWAKKESALMVEQKRLAALVESLQQEIAKFAQFKDEKTKLEARLAESEAELVKARKALSQQEIFVSAEDGLKAENAALKSEISALRTELTSLKKSHEKELAEHKSRAASSAEEVVLLKKTNNQLQSTPTTASSKLVNGEGEEIEHLRSENHRLQGKNEELRARNHAVLEHMHELEKKLGSGGGTSAGGSSAQPEQNKKSAEESKQALEEERALVADALQSIGNLPKFPQGADKKKYSKWLNDVSIAIKKRLESSTTSTSSNQANNDEELYKQALHRLSNELASIESAWSEQASKYEKEIAGYKKKLSQQPPSVDGGKRERAHTPPLHPQNHSSKSKAIPSSPEAEEGWEVVA